MCDLQVLTGLGILISGFISLPTGTLKSAHWTMIAFSAWFCTITHLSGLTALQHYFARDKDKHVAEKLVRVGMMAVIVIMLMVAMFPVGLMTGTSFGNCDAVCSFDPKAFEDRMRLMKSWAEVATVPRTVNFVFQFISSVVTIVLLFVSFVVRAIKLSPRIYGTKSTPREVVSRIKGTLSRRARVTLASLRNLSSGPGWGHSLWQELVVRLVEAAFLSVRGWTNFWSSMLFEAGFYYPPVIFQHVRALIVQRVLT